MTKLATFVIVLTLVCILGCSTKSADRKRAAEEELQYYPKLASVVHADRFKESFESPMGDAFVKLLLFNRGVVGVTDRFQRQYYNSLITVLSSPVVELPEFWVSIINTDDNDSGVRVHAMQSLFLRHVRIGDRLDKLSAYPGAAIWFTRDSVTVIAGGAGAPILPRNGDDILVRFDLSFLGTKDPWAIYLTVRGLRAVLGDVRDEIQMDVILDLLTNKRKQPHVLITGIAIL